MWKLATLLILFLSRETQASEENFQCSNIELAQDLDLTRSFDSVAAGISHDNCRKENHLVPKRIHWHVIPIPAGESPKIFMVPEGLVTPFVKSKTLKFKIEEHATEDYSKGDRIDAGVSIFLPPDQLKKIIVEGVDETIEITNNLTSAELDTMIIQNSGISNKLYVSSPNAKVQYEGSGVGNTASIEAASGSYVELSGIDQTVGIKTKDDLDVVMSGIDQELTIEGAYNSIEASGIDTKIFVNGPTRCDNIESSGISNQCSITSENVTVPRLACAASSTTVHMACTHWPTGAAVGAGIGFLVLVILLCGLSCWGCYRCCGCHRRESKFQQPFPEPNQKPSAPGEVAPPETGGDHVLEAEVISHTTVDEEDPFADNQSIPTPSSSQGGQKEPSNQIAQDIPDEKDTLVEAEIVIDVGDDDAGLEKKIQSKTQSMPDGAV